MNALVTTQESQERIAPPSSVRLSGDGLSSAATSTGGGTTLHPTLSTTLQRLGGLGGGSGASVSPEAYVERRKSSSVKLPQLTPPLGFRRYCKLREEILSIVHGRLPTPLIRELFRSLREYLDTHSRCGVHVQATAPAGSTQTYQTVRAAAGLTGCVTQVGGIQAAGLRPVAGLTTVTTATETQTASLQQRIPTQPNLTDPHAGLMGVAVGTPSQV